MEGRGGGCGVEREIKAWTRERLGQKERERTVVREIKLVENWEAGVNGRRSGREKVE